VYLLGNVLHAILLGAQDSVTPLIAIVCSTVVNVVRDFVGVVKFGLGGADMVNTAAEPFFDPAGRNSCHPIPTRGLGICLPTAQRMVLYRAHTTF